MILSREWLGEFTDVGHITDKEFAEAMTLSGSKVETFSSMRDEIKNVVVGKVEAIERHPDSDHLWVCQVNVGDETVQIVTGAQNVHAGDLVPVAKHKSLLPGGKKIEKGKLRGVESLGMLCSLGELGLDTHDFPDAIENGIWIITEEDAKVGMDIRELIGALDTQVEFEITPNRPDCLSVIGLAREAAATFGSELKLHTPVVKGSGGKASDYVSVTIENPELCPRYTARVVKNVKIGPSPRWMRRRLRASGVRPISNIVDITNYVMLEYGQPMHAFDFSCVEGGKIVVRTAREGESITTLDGKPHALSTSMLCICDENKPVCVAGVMGGANSEIIGDTGVVLFEAANFSGPSVRRTSNALGTRTDSSGRFEKGLDVMNTMAAVNRACELVELLGCGEVVDGVVDVFPAPPAQTVVKLEPEKINGLLGTEVSESEMRRILEKLDFELHGDDILVPSFRGDVEHYSDIAEEVARFYGYNNIPITLQGGAASVGGYSPAQLSERALGAVCRANGYSEIITYSFVSPASLDKICVPAESPLRDFYRILNPLGEDTSVMRTSALPSMLDILGRNRANRNDVVRLYEIAKIYLKPVDDSNGRYAREPKILSLGAYGGGMDFYKLKGAVESILEAMRIEGAEYAAVRDNPSYHPGRCASVSVSGKTLGVFGQVHPTVQKNYGSDLELYAAELSLDALIENQGAEPTYKALPRFPAVTRDIAVVADRDITVGEIEKTIRVSGGELLRDVRLFDVYEGPGILPGKRSTAYSMTLRSDEGTLTDDHADEVMTNVLTALREKLGAERR
ncbi:MAG: phenylalanine--tRNA ligase subunit beta [Oscillospiraceae bacterium]|nr:phenylalanine--tRNA ligase subunit beta [Oscillospiraceae bacterium]